MAMRLITSLSTCEESIKLIDHIRASRPKHCACVYDWVGLPVAQETLFFSFTFGRLSVPTSHRTNFRTFCRARIFLALERQDRWITLLPSCVSTSRYIAMYNKLLLLGFANTSFMRSRNEYFYAVVVRSNLHGVFDFYSALNCAHPGHVFSCGYGVVYWHCFLDAVVTR